MQDNVNVMLENMEKGNNLEASSANLATQAQQFNRTARSTQRHFRWQELKTKLIIGATCTTALTVVILLICSWAGAFDDKTE